MKKQTILSALVLASGVLGLVSCGGSNTATVKGSYSYTAWGTQYGMAVEVTYDTKSGKITSVTRDAATIAAENLVEVTATVTDIWNGTEMNTQYSAAIDAALKEYEGANYTELYNKIKNGVTVKYTNAEHSGVELSVTDDLKKDEQFIILTGATQTSVRTAVAIANAIASISTEDDLAPIVTAEPSA